MIKKTIFNNPTKLDYERIRKMKDDELIILRQNTLEMIKQARKLQTIVFDEMRNRKIEFLNKGEDSYYSYTIGFIGGYPSVKEDFIESTGVTGSLEEKIQFLFDLHGYVIRDTYLD